MFEGPDLFDIRGFPTSQMLSCGATLRRIDEEALKTQEAVARRLTDVFFERFRRADGEPAFALVRLYRTMLASRVPAVLEPAGLDAATRCLVLMGTRGLEPAWNDRTQSQGHQAIGLVDEDMVASTPMIAQLFASLGISSERLLQPQPMDLERDERALDVFHVEHALGSPFIPAQRDFVEPFGIASVVGFGGGLPDGELFVMLGFSREPITAEVAERFNTMSLQARIPLAPLSWRPVFAEDPDPSEVTREQRDRARTAGLEVLLRRQEAQVIEQSRALEARHAGTRQILDHVAQGLLTLDGDGLVAPEYSKILDEWFGSTPAGRELSQWLTACGVPEAAEFARAWRAGGDLPRLTVGAHLLDVSMQALSEGALVILTDVSAQRQIMEARAARERAEEANRAKSAFLAHISHELRTPLHAIIGYSELLEEELADAAQRAPIEDVHKIQAASSHLLSLISNILDLSKVEAGRMEVTREPVDLAEVLGELEDTGAPLVARNGSTLHVLGPDASVTLHTDGTKLYQILLNLLSNAAKFTHEGDVWVRARVEGERVTLEVEDTGVGIAPDEQEHVFEAFEQASTTTRRKHEGTGLGLALVREFATLLGGEVTLESALGEGSTFTVTLPLAAP